MKAIEINVTVQSFSRHWDSVWKQQTDMMLNESECETYIES